MSVSVSVSVRACVRVIKCSKYIRMLQHILQHLSKSVAFIFGNGQDFSPDRCAPP
jgi:hypothetical protein